ALTLRSVSAPQPGTARIESGRVVYQPPADFAGVASFVYVVVDRHGLEASSTVTVHVSGPQPVAPVANPDLLTLTVGAVAVLDPRSNDTDADGRSDALTIVAAAGARIGVRTEGGVLRITGPDAPGSYRIDYTVADRDGLTSSSVVTVNVVPA